MRVFIRKTLARPRFPLHAFMQTAQMPCQDAAVYCISYINSMAVGGKTANHMVDLLLEEYTYVLETRLDLYHEALDEYIEAH